MHWQVKPASDGVLWRDHLIRSSRSALAELGRWLTLLDRRVNRHAWEWQIENVVWALIVLAAIAAGVLIAQL
jgi:hypothetical protein